MSYSIWRDNIGSELEFWERLIRTEAERGHNRRAPAIVDHLPFLREHVRPPPKLGETVRVLDLGSGPFSTLGIPSPESGVKILYADPLGDAYNELLDKYGFASFPRITALRGEELSKSSGLAVFHWINCANALDHFVDPRAAFLEIFAACREGGVVTLVSIENEGRRENYTGLHQWNLRADSDGIWLSTRLETDSIDLMAELPFNVEYKWEYLDHGQTEFKIFGTLIRKGPRKSN